MAIQQGPGRGPPAVTIHYSVFIRFDSQPGVKFVYTI
jgi:hypothetical protein